MRWPASAPPWPGPGHAHRQSILAYQGRTPRFIAVDPTGHFLYAANEQSDTIGSSLVLFGRLKDDLYYRAKNILEQEA